MPFDGRNTARSARPSPEKSKRVRGVASADAKPTAYVDPPASFQGIVRADGTPVYGVANKREDVRARASAFNRRSTMPAALRGVIEEAPLLTDHLDTESRAHFDRFCELLDGCGIAFEVNPRLVRGLDYYNRTVFEWVTDQLGTQDCNGVAFFPALPDNASFAYTEFVRFDERENPVSAALYASVSGWRTIPLSIMSVFVARHPSSSKKKKPCG